MSVSLTLHLWWLYAWLGVGVVGYIPLVIVARSKVRPKMSLGFNLWPTYHGWTARHRAKENTIRTLLSIIAWPLAWWEALR